MEQEELRELESHCIQENDPTCRAACPLHVDARGLCSAVAAGDFTAGLKLYRRAVPFPRILSRICDQPCKSACRRAEVGEPLEMAALEKACLEYAAPLEKVNPLPQRRKRAAVIGSGLSGLTVAFDLAKKGYSVVVFESRSLAGGSLRELPVSVLPLQAIEVDLTQLIAMGVVIRLNTSVIEVVTEHDGGQFTIMDELFDCVYLGTGWNSPVLSGMDVDASGRAIVDPLTFATNRHGIFAGGSMVSFGETTASEASPVTKASLGRRAAVSMDRYMQRVSLTASRGNEGQYETRLYTNLEGIQTLGKVTAKSSGSGYSEEEAISEAKRCIQCECMECVKVCEYLHQFGSYPKRYIREIYNNLSIVSGERQRNKFTNSCSLCGLCAEVCPEKLDMGQVCLNARQLMVKQKRMPPSAHDFALRDMAFSNGDQFALSRKQPGHDTVKYLFFPGCQLPASSPDAVEKVYELLCMEGRGGLAGGVGLMLRCCGAPAEWAGRTDLFATARSEFEVEHMRLGEPELVLACSSCYQVFRTNYPKMKIHSLWSVLEKMELPARKVGNGSPLAIHDPCTARCEMAIQDSARGILTSLGYMLEELPLNREKTECCSYGGVVWQANPELSRQVIRRRVSESSRDYVTYCAMCRDLFAREGKRTLHLLDLIFNPEKVDKLASRRGPDYSDRHENRARLKQRMLKEVWKENMDPENKIPSVELIIDEPVRRIMEERLILVEDIQQVLAHAEQTGLRLQNRGSARSLAYFAPGVVTYWVEFSRQGEAYVIHNAYGHRMVIETGVQK